MQHISLALQTVFSEPPVDEYYEEDFTCAQDAVVFSVEYLPGQFDQRADSAEQCVKLLNEKETPVIRSATTYVLEGKFSEDDIARIKDYCINPVDSRETEKRNRIHWFRILKNLLMLRFLKALKICRKTS